jgi:hypothetical protein
MYIATQEWTKACFEELVEIGLASDAISDWTSSFNLGNWFTMPTAGDPSIYSMRKQAACSYLEGTDQPWEKVWVGSWTGNLQANVIRGGLSTDDGWDWVPISLIQGVNSPMKEDPTALPYSTDTRKQVWWRDPLMLLESQYDTPYGTFAIGNGSVTTSTGTAVGCLARAWNSGSVAIGYSALCGAGSKSYNPLITTSYTPSAFNDIGTAFKKTYRQSNSTAVGAYAQAGASCLSIGAAALSWMENGTAVGAAANTAGSNGTAVGQASAAGGNYSTAIGCKASAATQYATAIGYKAAVSGDGYTSSVYGQITSGDAHGTTEQNMSVALGAYSVVPMGETDVVSVGNADVDVFTKNYFSGVKATSSNTRWTEYPWMFNTDSDVKTSFYRRIINVADPINEHDAVTLGYLMRQQVPTLTKNSKGYYEEADILAWLDSIDDQSVACACDFRSTTYQANQDWMLYTELKDTQIGSISNLSPNYGIFWHRDAVADETGGIVWIDGLDDLADKPDDGTHLIIRKPLSFSFKCKKSTGQMSLRVASYPTSSISTTTLDDGTVVPLEPLMRWKLPKYAGAGSKEGVVISEDGTYDKYLQVDMTTYVQIMWILTKAKYCLSRNMGSNKWLEKTLTLTDPTELGYEYGDQMSAYLLGKDIQKVLPIIPEGTPFYLKGKSSSGTAYDPVRVEVQMTWDADETHIEAMLDNTFTYSEGDTWTMTGVPFPTGSVTHGADGWQQASSYNASVLGTNGYVSFMKQSEFFMDVFPYKVGGVELGIAPLACDITVRKTQAWTKYASYNDSLEYQQAKFQVTSPFGSDTFESIQLVNISNPIYESHCNVLEWMSNARMFMPTRLNSSNGAAYTGLVVNNAFISTEDVDVDFPLYRNTSMTASSESAYSYGNFSLFSLVRNEETKIKQGFEI